MMIIHDLFLETTSYFSIKYHYY